MDEVTVVDVSDQIVLGLRRKGSYRMITDLIPEVFQYAMENGAQLLGGPVFLCHETSAEEAKEADREGKADVEVVIPVAGKIDGAGEIACYELPGGKMAKIIHKGPYEECGQTYEKLFAWIEDNGKRIVAPIREVYLNDPREVSPREILTEIYAPID